MVAPVPVRVALASGALTQPDALLGPTDAACVEINYSK